MRFKKEYSACEFGDEKNSIFILQLVVFVSSVPKRKSCVLCSAGQPNRKSLRVICEVRWLLSFYNRKTNANRCSCMNINCGSVCITSSNPSISTVCGNDCCFAICQFLST